jgi:hypothetical protein
VTDAATAYVASHAGGTQPFYMNLAYSAVHTPITPRADLAAKYNALPSTDPRHTDPNYAAFAETLDQAVGRVMAAVNDPNGDGNTSDSIAANTLLVFTSDNGGFIGDTDNTPLRESKGTQREGGLRVPLIAVMPGTIAAGTINDEAIHAVDFYPTYAEFAGASLPSLQMHVLDGESFAGILRGDKSALNRDAVFWHFPGYLDDRSVPTSVITKDTGGERYKLLYFYEDQRYELFNLTDDLGETTDLLASPISAADYAIARQMSSDLRAWLDDQGALYPTVRATGAPVPPPAPLTAEPPPIVMTFGLGRDPTTPDATSHQLEQNGLTMQLTAVGNGGLLDWNNNGVGVNSTQDTGTDSEQRRINGALASPESIRFSFDDDVAIRSMLIGSISAANETLSLSFVSGTNPFIGLAGYTGDYQLTANSLRFTASSGTAPLLVPFGEAGQDKLFVSAGTVLAITANPATGQGILFDEITVERIFETFGGDYNHSHFVDAADYVVWRKTDDTAAGYSGWLTHFGQPAGSGSGGSLNANIPEPATLVMFILAAACVLARRLGTWRR